MSAITYFDNDIKLQYRDIVCEDRNTSFLNKYLELPELRRLNNIHQFCGCDYTNIHDSIISEYTRLDHSLVVSKMTYHFTKNKKASIAALFHDVLTPAFAHANDFRKGDAKNQESSETNEYNTFTISKELIEYLNKDGISIEDIFNIEKYPILENSSPKLCTDRLDGVIHTNLIWRPYWSITDIRRIYNNIIVLKNENNISEIGFKDIELAEEFGNGIFKYAKVLQLHETNYSLQFVSDVLQSLIDEKIITEEDIHKNLSEDEIEYIILNSRLKEVWKKFNSSQNVIRCNKKPKDIYYFSSETEVKKRVVDPLCLYNGNVYRLSEISNMFNSKLQEYYAFKDSKYCYVKGIRKI